MAFKTSIKKMLLSPAKQRWVWPIAAVFLAGCAAMPGFHLFGVVLLFVSALSFSTGCTSSESTSKTTDAVSDACSGAWEACCSDGVITTCCCPDDMACNYGWFTDCGDNTCTLGEECGTSDAISSDTTSSDASSSDTTISDATNGDAGCDGNWESCCVDGLISNCCCPEGMACNFGMYEDCGDGVCNDGGQTCEPGDTTQTDATSTDATVTDAKDSGDTGCDGNWESCCISGEVSSCCCPEGADCNYGWYTTCDDGSCVGIADSCDGADTSETDTSETDANPTDSGDSPDAGCDGEWETCCTNNAISTCCCPENMACNYGMFFTCDDGSCSIGPDGCDS